MSLSNPALKGESSRRVIINSLPDGKSRVTIVVQRQLASFKWHFHLLPCKNCEKLRNQGLRAQDPHRVEDHERAVQADHQAAGEGKIIQSSHYVKMTSEGIMEFTGL